MKRPRLFTALLLTLLLFTACSSRSTPEKTPVDLGEPQATYLGQDGGEFAGESCSGGATTDNIHIHISGLRTDEAPSSYHLVDGGPGVWANPCNPQSNWLLYAKSTRRGEADLYFKPYRNVTRGEPFTLTVKYGDGASQVLTFKAADGSAGLASEPAAMEQPAAVEQPAAMEQPAAALEVDFLGQDGGSAAGELCSSGTKKDNVHIHINGLKTNAAPVRYRVSDKSGLWATPCDPVSNWFLFVSSPAPDQADLYFKPYRDAPDGTIYAITIDYDDGTSQGIEVQGKRVKP